MPWSCTIPVVLSCSITWMIYVSLATIITIKTRLSTIGNFTDRWSDVEQKYRCTSHIVVVYIISACRLIIQLTRNILWYSALSMYSGCFSLYNSRKTPHSSPVRARYGCRSWVQIWPKFYHCNCCAVCTIISYITAIYQESIVLVSK